MWSARALSLAAGALAVLLALPLAVAANLAHEMVGASNRSSEIAAAALLGCTALVPAAVYLAGRRLRASADVAALLLLTGVAVCIAASYLYWVSSLIVFPADFLAFSESDFVADITKLREGYPVFTDQSNNQSLNYPPGAPLITYGIALLTGHPRSIPLLRATQLVFALGAAVLATACVRHLHAIATGEAGVDGLWTVAATPFLFLVATNASTNGYVHVLHNDSLAQLLTLFGYYLVVRLAVKPSGPMLVAMALLPAFGFLVKQNLALWAVLFPIALVAVEGWGAWKRAVLLASACFGGLVITIGLCYLAWGDDFVYWTFGVLGTRSVSLVRAAGHVAAAWPYLAMGLVGSVILLGGAGSVGRRLFGPWLIAVLVITAAVYTSGISFLRNHLGPPSLLCAVWFVTGIVRGWPDWFCSDSASAWSVRTLRVALLTAALLLVPLGLDVVRRPSTPLTADARRYVAAIERQFDDLSAETVLLDHGSWIYLSAGVVQKDRAATIGERGYSQTGDFTAFLDRLRRHHYAKILVRRLEAPDFWYEHEMWPERSGIRDAMLTYYRVVDTIPYASVGFAHSATRPAPYFFDDVSVLVPRVP